MAQSECFNRGLLSLFEPLSPTSVIHLRTRRPLESDKS